MSISTSITVLSFYTFTQIESPQILLSKILLVCKKKYIKGTILISNEGINGSIAGCYNNVNYTIEHIKAISACASENIDIKINYCTNNPFDKLKVKLKKEIITMGIAELDVPSLKGTYIYPQDWDNFINQDDCIVIDTRNKYETDIGTFKNSILPNTNTFKQFPEWVQNNKAKLINKKIAMFCTGGVRCEKSTAYLKSLGFKQIYHLKGGILNYLEQTQNSNNTWQGKCFVFDNREAVDQNLKPVAINYIF